MTDSLFLRAPVLQIAANPVTTGISSKSKSKSHAGAIAGGTIGGIAALLGIGAIALVANRRRSRRRQSVGSAFEREIITSEWPMSGTPFNQAFIGVPMLDSGAQTDLQQRRTEPVEPEGAPLVHSSPSSDSPVLSPYVVPFPVGLSSKELARLRNGSLRSQSGDPWPVASTTELVSSEAQRLQSEVESLRREMQQLRAERPEAPPSYHEDGGA